MFQLLQRRTVMPKHLVTMISQLYSCMLFIVKHLRRSLSVPVCKMHCMCLQRETTWIKSLWLVEQQSTRYISAIWLVWCSPYAHLRQTSKFHQQSLFWNCKVFWEVLHKWIPKAVQLKGIPRHKEGTCKKFCIQIKFSGEILLVWCNHA